MIDKTKLAIALRMAIEEVGAKFVGKNLEGKKVDDAEVYLQSELSEATAKVFNDCGVSERVSSKFKWEVKFVTDPPFNGMFVMIPTINGARNDDFVKALVRMQNAN